MDFMRVVAWTMVIAMQPGMKKQDGNVVLIKGVVIAVFLDLPREVDVQIGKLILTHD